MKPTSILLLLSATLTTAASPQPSLHTHLQRRHHQIPEAPVLIRRAKPGKVKNEAKPASTKKPDSQQQQPRSIRALSRLNQFDKSKYTIPGASRHAMLMGATSAGDALMAAGSAAGGGSASALLAAGGGMQTAGYLGMAANHIFENGREAVREARVKKSV